jgi:putative ABC transport system permease protein
MLWKIALRNTVRHDRRTIITAVVMAAGISVFIVFDSILAGMDRITVDNMADYTVSSLKIRNPAYVEDMEANPLNKGLENPSAVLAELAKEGILATARVRFVARLSNYEDVIPVLADAVDPVTDTRVFKTGLSLSVGSWLDAAGPKAVVLGADLAKELKLKVGDYVLISARTVNDTTNADEYEIVGLVRTPAPEINKSGLFMRIPDALALLDTASLVTEVDGALPRAANLNATLEEGAKAAARLSLALPGARVDPIGELAKDYLMLRGMKAKYSFIIILIVLLIAAVGTVNTILMSVYSRIREIGVLRAYGMTRADISRLFTLEGLSLGIIGSLLGVALGVVFDYLAITKGISLESYQDSLGSLPMADILRGEWNPATMVVGFVFGIVVSVVATRIPARKAAKLEPTEALRFQ